VFNAPPGQAVARLLALVQEAALARQAFYEGLFLWWGIEGDARILRPAPKVQGKHHIAGTDPTRVGFAGYFRPTRGVRFGQG